MSSEQHLEWERRFGKPAAAAAFLAAGLTLASLVYHGSVIKATATRTTADILLSVHRQPSAYLVLAILSSLATVALVPVLVYLFKATSARRPQVPGAALYLAALGPVVFAVVGIVSQLHDTDVAKRFAAGLPTAGAAGDSRARHLAGGAGLVGVQLASALAVAFALVLICVFAMRAGLLGRVMGYAGVAIGALTVLFFGLSTTAEILWLPALGALFLNRWPGGRGPAWETGEAIPWPTTADRRAQLDEEAAAAQGPARSGFTDNGHGKPIPSTPSATAGAAESVASATTHPRSKKRKRKRR
ncbi:MAG: hypothetical protein NVSMB25_04330 [Thermoleophilaceae bacterium]